MCVCVCFFCCSCVFFRVVCVSFSCCLCVFCVVRVCFLCCSCVFFVVCCSCFFVLFMCVFFWFMCFFFWFVCVFFFVRVCFFCSCVFFFCSCVFLFVCFFWFMFFFGSCVFFGSRVFFLFVCVFFLCMCFFCSFFFCSLFFFVLPSFVLSFFSSFLPPFLPSVCASPHKERSTACHVWHMSARTRVPSRLSNTGGSRGLTARLCFPSSHVRATVCSTSLSSVLELGSAAWCSQWRPFSSQRCGDSRRILRKRLSRLAWTMLPPWPTTLGHHWLNGGRGDSAWNLWESHAVVLATWIETWLRVGRVRTYLRVVVLLLCVFCFFPIVFLSCFSLSPFTFPLAHLSHLLCLVSRPLVTQSCADRFFEVTQAIERGQLKETDEDSNEDGIIESWGNVRGWSFG